MRNIFCSVFIFYVAVNTFALSPSDITDQQPVLMNWLRSEPDSIGDLRIHIEKSSVEESVYSGVQSKMLGATKIALFSVDLGFNLNQQQHIGIQFGQTRLPLVNVALSLNYQYDWIVSEKSKILMGAMYGGFIYPRTRAGIQVAYSYEYKNINFYLQYSYLNSDRFFQKVTETGTGNYLFDNNLDYNLASYYLGGGLEFQIQKIAYFKISCFYETGSISNIRNEQYSPSNFSRTNGGNIILDLIFYIEKDHDLTLTSSSQLTN